MESIGLHQLRPSCLRRLYVPLGSFPALELLVVLDQIGAANLDCVLAKDQYDTNIVTSHKRINHYLHSEDDPVNKDVSQFAAAVKRVPLFAGLQPAQAVTLLKVCKRRSLAAGETLCRFGDRSDKMYILLSGELSVRTADDTQIAKLSALEAPTPLQTSN